MAAVSELDRIDPDPQLRTLSTGLEVEVVRLKTRQFFRLLKILTHGVGPGILQSNLNFGDDPAEFAQKLITLVLMSIPDAEEETIWFLASMCRPHGLVTKAEKDLSKAEKKANDALWDQFNSDLGNPELDDTIDIIEAIVNQEAEDIQALGKRVASMLKLAQKTGADKEEKPEDPSPQQLNSPASSPGSSTSSATSTDGPTSTSSTSRSAGSGSASKRRRGELSKTG